MLIDKLDKVLNVQRDSARRGFEITSLVLNRQIFISDMKMENKSYMKFLFKFFIKPYSKFLNRLRNFEHRLKSDG